MSKPGVVGRRDRGTPLSATGSNGPSARASALRKELPNESESWPTEQQATYQAMQDPAETARYIAQLTAELSAMAGGARLETLAYLLSMARVEAEMIARAQDD